MAIQVHSVDRGSLSDKAKIVAGSLIMEINGHRIHNFLELQYYAADDVLNVHYRLPDGTERDVVIEQDWVNPLGITPGEHKCRDCANNCIFCFIDQMPTGFRDTLNVKDDDYTFSFVYGNYISLTNMSDYDFQQIVEMQLSPLYVSVHTTNPVLRQKMMRYKQEFDILARLKYLSDNDISLETQIVVVPGWNDGEELRKSLTDLSSPELKIESIGVVPVGLTKYRTGLTELKIVDAEEAEAIIAMSEEIKEQFGSDNIYCSDELFIKAGREIPPEDYYNGYPQIENGIGMIRLMLENWDMNRIEWMETFIAIQDQIVFVTAVLAAPYIQKIVDEINQHIPGKSRVAVIRNEFFGETVTVAGLLTWEDIISQVNLQTREVPILPSSIFSIDDLTIDNKKKEDFEAEWKREVVIIDSLLEIEDKEESFYEI
jgi:putative radical SAM enzyme (TIGR03279 family)